MKSEILNNLKEVLPEKMAIHQTDLIGGIIEKWLADQMTEPDTTNNVVKNNNIFELIKNLEIEFNNE